LTIVAPISPTSRLPSPFFFPECAPADHQPPERHPEREGQDEALLLAGAVWRAGGQGAGSACVQLLRHGAALQSGVRPGGVVPGTASPLRSSLHGLSLGFSLSIDGGTQAQGHARCDQKTRCLRRELRAVHATVLQHSHPQIRQGFQVNFNKFGIFYYINRMIQTFL